LAERIQSHVSSFSPPIAFLRSQRASIKHETADFREFEIKFDPCDKKSQKTKKSILTFEDGDADMWCEWREQLEDLYGLIPLTTAEQKAKAIVSLLRGKALALYLTHRPRLEHEQADLVDSLDDVLTIEDILERSLDQLAKEFFPIKHTYRRQVFYMRYHLFTGGENTVCEVDMRLNRMNDYLLYFSTIEHNDNKFKQGGVLRDDQLCNIINLAKKPEWSLKMMEANVDPYDLGLHDLVLNYLERLELVDSLQKHGQRENPNAQQHQEVQNTSTDS
jgi:hypothetical protein